MIEPGRYELPVCESAADIRATVPLDVTVEDLERLLMMINSDMTPEEVGGVLEQGSAKP